MEFQITEVRLPGKHPSLETQAERLPGAAGLPARTSRRNVSLPRGKTGPDLFHGCSDSRRLQIACTACYLPGVKPRGRGFEPACTAAPIDPAVARIIDQSSARQSAIRVTTLRQYRIGNQVPLCAPCAKGNCATCGRRRAIAVRSWDYSNSKRFNRHTGKGRH